MTFMKMFQSAAIVSAVCFFGANAPSTWAQDNGVDGPPKILVIQREFVKPGKPPQHAKTESAYVRALAAGKATPRYLAMTALSGKPRVLFFSGYASLGAWEDETKGLDKDAALSAALDRVNAADGDLLTDMDQSVWTRRDDLSLNTGNLQGDRYMEIIQFVLRPGHTAEWEELVHEVQAGYKKGVPDANWAMFQMLYGPANSTFIAVIKLKSLAEADKNMASDKQFADAMGEDGLKKLDDLEAKCVESRQTNLFSFSPAMSYPPDAWTKAEPNYWKQPTAGAAKKAAQ